MVRAPDLARAPKGRSGSLALHHERAGRAMLVALALLFGASCQAREPVREPMREQRAAPAVTIPFELDAARIIVQVEARPGLLLPFIVDTGLARAHLIDTDAATGLGLEAGRKLGFVSPDGTQRSGGLTEIAELRIGDARLTAQPFAVVDLPDAITARPGRPPLAGFVGAPLLDDAVLCIDYRAQQLQRFSRQAFDASGWSSVPLRLAHGLPTVQMEIDGRKATLIVDSGNNAGLVVSASFAQENDFASRYRGFEVSSAHMGGEAVEILSGEAQRARLAADAAFRDVPLMVTPDGFDPSWGIDGMLGYELLRLLNPCLDREGGRLLYRRRQGEAP
jgi:hypothetical protein